MEPGVDAQAPRIADVVADLMSQDGLHRAEQAFFEDLGSVQFDLARTQVDPRHAVLLGLKYWRREQHEL